MTMGEMTMSVCKKLHMAKKDEADGILEYVKLKDSLISEYQEKTKLIESTNLTESTEIINTIENIIIDENRHLEEILMVIRELNCPELTITEEICILAKDIYEKANKIEKLSEYIDKKVESSDRKKIHDIVEEIEKKVKEIKSVILK
jgi:rubrerythrin